MCSLPLIGGAAQLEPLLQHADEKAADDVDSGDDQGGDGVTADELTGAVHGAVEVGLPLQRAAPRPRLLLGDVAGTELGVDAHLLAG